MDIAEIPSKAYLLETAKRIKPFIKRTPILTCSTINNIVGANIYFKCENFQKVGAFKFRGATNAVLTLSENEKQKGIATHSSGNHAQAVALAAKMQKIPAYIVMPTNAPAIKKKAVLEYGATVIDCEPTLQAREEGLRKVVEETGAEFIPPYNDYRVIAGQATIGMELINEVADLDFIITPVGGGGMLSGVSLAAHYFSPKTKVIAGEPKGADDAFLSFQAKELISVENPNTIADGLRTSLGEKGFRIILKHVNNIYTVEENEIIEAMRLVWERMKIIIEPSSAVPLAALIKNKVLFKNKKIGLVFSGANVDLSQLPFA